MNINYNISVEHGGEDLCITPVVRKCGYGHNRLHFYNADEFAPMNIDDFERQSVTRTSPATYAAIFSALSTIFGRGKITRKMTGVVDSLFTLFNYVRFIAVPHIVNYFNILKYCTQNYYNRPGWFLSILRIRLSLSCPVWCVKIHQNLSLRTHGQLCVVDPEGLTEDYYLTPSQKLLEQWYETRVNSIKNSEFESERRRYQEYQELKLSLARDEEIYYIAELDT